jgi:hypothetical protein
MRSWSDGWRRVFAAPAIIAGVFLVTLLTALPLAVSLRGALQSHLGASLMAGEAADAVNYDWWQEFASQATGVGSTFTPSIIGFATTLDSISGLLDKRVLITPIAWALGFYVAAWIFLSGGILDRYARGRRIGALGFFAASGTFFFRFLRLGIAAGVVYGFLFVYVHEWLFTKWYLNVTRDLSVEPTVFFWRLLMYAIFGGLLALTTTTFDYAKVRAVVEDRRSMMGALVASLRFLVRNPLRVASLYATNAATFLVVVAVWSLIAPGAGGAGPAMWGAVIATQCYMLARLLVKLQFMASETTLFQRSLAHVGYIAAPAPVRPDPPIVETL